MSTSLSNLPSAGGETWTLYDGSIVAKQAVSQDALVKKSDAPTFSDSVIIKMIITIRNAIVLFP